MSAKINQTVKILVEAQESLAGMSTEERMLVGERLVVALRKAGTLQRQAFQHESYGQECEVVAGAFQLTINASFKPLQNSGPGADVSLDEWLGGSDGR
ncbi:hypothetical protein Q8W71_15525 [Methylobacterium sp. NEAU 140]|uniref:hypothetical protein n=1 Tax=Methylobacterium sp. NEAU 140 TaxID=3064945 RepID=UPI00273640F8|nr:hypothetical protein [Methylobacterium sp. NEAU 140]MDP4024039.1 hypothetical protein [Methylobacterium sp. NEAU 140]